MKKLKAISHWKQREREKWKVAAKPFYHSPVIKPRS